MHYRTRNRIEAAWQLALVTYMLAIIVCCFAAPKAAMVMSAALLGLVGLLVAGALLGGLWGLVHQLLTGRKS